MTDALSGNPGPQVTWDGVISLDHLEKAAKEQLEKNAYSWIDPNYVLRLVSIAHGADYYKAQYDDLMESNRHLRSALDKLARQHPPAELDLGGYAAEAGL